MFQIREMTIDDYDGVRAMWEATPGVSVRDADSKAAVTRYLLRNPALSFVALADDQMVATIMAGHDGRRGYLQHLVVLPAYRRRGIANALVEQTLAALEALGIHKSHLEVLCTTSRALPFGLDRVGNAAMTSRDIHSSVTPERIVERVLRDAPHSSP